jgi:hypothetical protein
MAVSRSAVSQSVLRQALPFTEIVGDQIDRLNIAVWHDRRSPFGPTHQSNSYEQTVADSFGENSTRLLPLRLLATRVNAHKKSTADAL